MTDVAPIRFGILGAANIARSFIRGVAGSATARVDAVASRDGEKGAAFATEMGVPRSHGSYEALLADPAIDAIYVPLPNDMHAEWVIRALQAGKHVLCEKPLAMTVEEARSMFAVAKACGVHLAEAYPYMSQPQTLRMAELIAEGAIGRVQMVTGAFSFSLVTPKGAPLGDPANIRLDPARGGGALLDAGTYAMSFVSLVLKERPTRVLALAKYSESDVDQTIAATLDFASGAMAQITCSFARAGYRHAVVIGEEGVIETSYSNHAPQPDGLSLRIRRTRAQIAPFETLAVDGGDGFRLEAESFVEMIRKGPAHWNGASEACSIDTVLALQAIAESGRSGGWVDLRA